MMRRRQDVLDGRMPDTRRDVVVDGRPLQHATVCPHLGGRRIIKPNSDGCITCPWHGYRFDLRTGRCADVPGLHLEITGAG
jgi:nitrite reductase/ring-hydroxylating ferredoxin subunit